MTQILREALITSIVCLMLGGCATSRSELKLNSPITEKTDAIASVDSIKHSIFIHSINDRRKFEQAPSNPSIPSLGFEGATQADAAIKARAIGRKRNGFGKALGDVLLDDGQTVTNVVREHLVAAFTAAGYSVESDPLAPSIPIVIDVDVQKFWAWFQPGFWAITLNADIVIDINAANSALPRTITVHVQDQRQLATDGAWMEIVQQALQDLRAQIIADKISP